MLFRSQGDPSIPVCVPLSVPLPTPVQAKDKERGREDVSVSGSRGKLSSALSPSDDVLSSVCPPENTQQSSVGTPHIVIADNIDNRLVDKIVLANKESGPQSAPPRGNDCTTKDKDNVATSVEEVKPTNNTEVNRGTLEVNKKGAEGRAIFVRFAVVSRTEKAVTAHSIPSTQLGSSSSYQSLTSVGSLPCPTPAPPVGMGGSGFITFPAALSSGILCHTL